MKTICVVTGVFAVLMIILAFTSGPLRNWYGMAVKKAGISRTPDFIVVLGGGGMPSESGLIRCWYGAQAATQFPEAKVIVALPGDAGDSLSSVNLMKKELVIRGISPERIMLEDSGTNTRAVALAILKIITNDELRITNYEKNLNPPPASLIGTRKSSILIVTSPEHLLRAIKTFNKVGFTKVDGLPAFEKTIEADLNFNGKKLGGHAWFLDIGKNITVRYQFWMQLHYELLVVREWTALAYYKMMGWN